MSLAKWWYNTTFHLAIQKTPFKSLYGQPPPLRIPYVPGHSVEKGVDRNLITREFKAEFLKFHIARGQQRMVSMANQHRTDREFEQGDWVYLKNHPYRQLTISNKTFQSCQLNTMALTRCYKRLVQLPTSCLYHLK